MEKSHRVLVLVTVTSVRVWFFSLAFYPPKEGVSATKDGWFLFYLDVSKNSATPKWMVYSGKPY